MTIIGKLTDMLFGAQSTSNVSKDSITSVERNSSTSSNKENMSTGSTSSNGKKDQKDFSKQEIKLSSTTSQKSNTKSSSKESKSRSKGTASTSTPGKHQRSINTDFLGNKYIEVKCDKCCCTFEAMSIDKINKTCPRCSNPEPEDILSEYKDPNGCNCYSCMAGRAMRKAANEAGL